MTNFSKRNRVSFNGFTSASATTDVESAVYDMQGYEGIVALTHFATTASGQTGSASGNGLFARVSSASSTGTEQSSGTFIPGTSTAQVLDLYRPQQRYVQFGVKRSGAGTKVGSLVVVQYGAHVQPTTNATTVTVETFASPATGTI